MPFLRWGFCTLTHQLLNLDMDPSPPPYALCSNTHIPPLPHFIHIRIPALSAQTLTALPPPSAGLTPSGSPAETPQQAPPDTDCHFLLLVTQTLSPRGSSFRGHRSHPPPSALWAGRRGDASRHLDADAAFHPITRTLTFTRSIPNLGRVFSNPLISRQVGPSGNTDRSPSAIREGPQPHPLASGYLKAASASRRSHPYHAPSPRAVPPCSPQ